MGFGNWDRVHISGLLEADPAVGLGRFRVQEFGGSFV